jgi:cyclopropane fatty-acyl-phospholipid synthase-like methyltransferase|eukprot:COSAG01_NODE_4153_length_5292_cov_11.627768_5_plen_67_part_00
MSCHTTRYAQTLALYADSIRSQNASAAAAMDLESRRSWAWASYCMDANGEENGHRPTQLTKTPALN